MCAYMCGGLGKKTLSHDSYDVRGGRINRDAFIPTHCFKIEKSEAQSDCDLSTENENFLSLDSLAPSAQS